MYKTPRLPVKLSINWLISFVYKVIGIKTRDDTKLVNKSSSNGL
jgi:hypothetical protein